MTHCPECHNLSGTCPGCPECPECLDAAKWHEAIMEETCDAGTQDEHCACVPILRKACAERDQQIATLTAEFASLTAKYQALDRMFTHAGIVKAQETHNQMVAERDGVIAELREALAQAHNAAGA